MLLKAKYKCHKEGDRLSLDKWNEYLCWIHKWRGWYFGCVVSSYISDNYFCYLFFANSKNFCKKNAKEVAF